MDSSMVTLTPPVEAISDEAVGLAAIFGVLAGMIATIAVLGIIWWVLTVIAKWKIFTKAGEKGWKSLVPIYSDYISFKLFWDVKYFWIMLVASFVAGFISSFISGSKDPSLILSLIGLAISIYIIVLDIQLLHRFSKSFGHGAGFTVGLIFLNNIFLLILGFNGDKYHKISA